MSPRPRHVAIALLVACVAIVPRPAAAQNAAESYALGAGRVSLGGEFTATAGRHDVDAFFNYTDYEHDALRFARLRLLAEWRLPRQLALLGEVRTENGDGVTLAALYARWRPWANHAFDLQAGRIPPVIGAFARRAYGRDNILIGVPLAYQYLTALRPDALPATPDDLLRMRARGWQPSFPLGATTIAPGVPLVSAFRWDTGAEARWRAGWLEVAGAVTRGAPAVPVVHETNSGRQLSARAAVEVPGGLTLGVSGARGQWIDASALALAPAAGPRASRQSVVGIDAEYSYLHWLVRAEWLRSAFGLPLPVDGRPDSTLTAWSGFLESRYRFTPRWQAAVRVERLAFGPLPGPLTVTRPAWDASVNRVEAVAGFRVLRNLEVRVGWQQDWRDGGRVRARGFPACQLLYWF